MSFLSDQMFPLDSCGICGVGSSAAVYRYPFSRIYSRSVDDGVERKMYGARLCKDFVVEFRRESFEEDYDAEKGPLYLDGSMWLTDDEQPLV